MYPRWFNVSVVLLWLASMGWLLTEKVLPPLLVGQPPSYRTILEAQRREPRVGWSMALNGRRLGWAVTTTQEMAKGSTELRSFVHFDELPLDSFATGLIRSLQIAGPPRSLSLMLDAENVVIIDPLGRLWDFESTVRVGSMMDAIKLHGSVEGDRLKLTVRAGEFRYETDAFLPRRAILGDVLSPQTQLPGLRFGQTWTVPVYSPLNPNNPLEVLQATVQQQQTILFDGQRETVWQVVYRSDSGTGLGSGETPRGQLWVRRDGTVLRQQVTLFGSVLSFSRLADEQAAELEGRVERRRRAPYGAARRVGTE